MAETARFVTAVAAPGGLRAGASGWQISVHVRLMHAQVRRLLGQSGRWDRAQWAEPIDFARAREYRRLAADQLIKTGHVDEGLTELDHLLRSVGLQLPRSMAGAVSGFVWEQIRSKLLPLKSQRTGETLGVVGIVG